MTKNIVIIGTGAHAAELEGYIFENIQKGEKINLLGFTSPDKENYDKYSLISPYLGNNSRNPDILKENPIYLLGFSNIVGRDSEIKNISSHNNYYNFIHYSARIFRTVKMGYGNIICPDCQIGPSALLGNYNLLNNRVNIGHDSVIGDNNIFCPNVGLSGFTEVGANNFFSLNTSSIPKVSIGNNNVIAPNMTIEKSIENESYFFHRFKEKILFK